MSLASRSDELDKKLEGNSIDSSIETLVKDAARARRNVRLLAASIALDFILTIVLAVVSYKTNELAHLAQTTKQAVIQNCETANDPRLAQKQLWGYVLSLTPSQPRTPEQEDRVKEFAKFVDQTFKPRDCQAEANKK